MRSPRRSTWMLAAAVALGIAVLAPSPAQAASGPAYPTQSLGDRGTDVKAIQLLLTARGFPLTVDGIYGPATQAAVVDWKAAAGISPASSYMDAASWEALTPYLKPGATGPAVLAAQRELRAKRHLSVPLDGVWASTTTAAVKAFQKHEGMRGTGTMNEPTWRRLIAHFELPTFNATSLCDYSVGNGPANWGTSAAINMLEAAARVEAAAGHRRVAVGDIGFQYGGALPGHKFHRVGMEIDIRPMRKARNECRRGVDYHSSAYDRAATRTLIKAIRASAPGHVKLIYFNDPVLIREGLTRHYSGHDDHLHVRYCELTAPDPHFAC